MIKKAFGAMLLLLALLFPAGRAQAAEYRVYTDENGETRCEDSAGNPLINDFYGDGEYTYYFQADGTAMKNRLTYHPDGVHVIYFDAEGHEVFSDFAHVKQSVSGEAVDDFCFFNVYGYMYVDVVTYDKTGTVLYYTNPYGVMEMGTWFRFSEQVRWADGRSGAEFAGRYGCAREDGTLIVNTQTTDWLGRSCYLQGNGVALYEGEPQPSLPAEKAFSIGTVSGKVYQNPMFDLTIELPEGYSFLSNAYISLVTKIAPADMNDEYIRNYLNTEKTPVPLCIGMGKNGKSAVGVLIFKPDAEILQKDDAALADELFAELPKQFTDDQAEIESSEKDSFLFRGAPKTFVKVTAIYNKERSYFRGFLLREGDYMILVASVAPSAEESDSLLRLAK